MKATAVRNTPTSFTHRVEIRQHQLRADEPAEQGGDDEGPTPQELLAASLASCVAITVEMYAKRKHWQIGPIEVDCEYEVADPGSSTHFVIVLRLPSSCAREQVERLKVIAGKCPVHRILAGEVTFDERVERVEPAGN